MQLHRSEENSTFLAFMSFLCDFVLLYSICCCMWGTLAVTTTKKSQIKAKFLFFKTQVTLFTWFFLLHETLEKSIKYVNILWLASHKQHRKLPKSLLQSCFKKNKKGTQKFISTTIKKIFLQPLHYLPCVLLHIHPIEMWNGTLFLHAWFVKGRKIKLKNGKLNNCFSLFTFFYRS
jgi:hypothetical protein